MATTQGDVGLIIQNGYKMVTVKDAPMLGQKKKPYDSPGFVGLSLSWGSWIRTMTN
jgi:hypothetical protein